MNMDRRQDLKTIVRQGCHAGSPDGRVSIALATLLPCPTLHEKDGHWICHLTSFATSAYGRNGGMMEILSNFLFVFFVRQLVV